MALSDINTRIFRVSTLAGKAEKGPFFRYWLEKLENITFCYCLGWKSWNFIFSTPFNFYWSIEYNILNVQNELITSNTYNN